MAQYRKKPVVIEAVQFTGKPGNIDEIVNLMQDGSRDLYFDLAESISSLIIPTLEGDMKANVGDWVIKGIKGECYPRKPDIFEATYELVT